MPHFFSEKEPHAHGLLDGICDSFGMYGGDDGARTRDLCRDRAQETGNL